MSLKMKIFTRCMALSVLLIVAIVATHVAYMQDFGRRQLEERYTAQVLTQASRMERLVLWDDRMNIMASLESLIESDDHLAYAFVEREGNPYAHTFQDGVPRMLLGRHTSPTPQDWLFKDKHGERFHDISARVGNTNAVLHIAHSAGNLRVILLPLLARTGVVGVLSCLVAVVLSMLLAHRTTREVDTATGALRENEQQLRLLADNTADIIWMVDLSLVFTYVSPAVKTVLGYTAEDRIGTNFSELVSPENLADTANLVATLVEQGPSAPALLLDFDMLHRDGHAVPIEIKGRVIFNAEGRPIALQGTSRDITERKQAEDALRESEQRFRTIFDNAPLLIDAFDENGRCILWNKHCVETFGWTIDELNAKGDALALFYPDAAVHDEVLQTITTDPDGRFREWHPVTKEGKTLITRWANFRLPNNVVFSFGHDITERKRLEEQLRVSQKMEAVGQLAGGIAHDFNNLLQAINGYSDLALMGMDESDPAHEPITQVAKAGAKAKVLVRQILGFSRRQVLDMKDVDLNDLISDLMKMVRNVIGEHIRLEVVSGVAIASVQGDPGQIEQIVMNLCVNARDAMPDGGTITIETENVRINEEYCKTHAWGKPGRYVLLSVTDTGHGMDAETLEKIFEPFFTTKEVGKGTGLGLSMVYGLVKQHEGIVQAYSEVGKGTTIKIYLPALERSANDVGNKIEGPVSGGTETILLAEDNEGVLGVVKAMLERAGYKVLIATDGEEALRVFDEHADEIDLALLDVVMPKMGGNAVYERIREGRPDLRFLFASGYSMNAVHTNFILDTGKALIQKPYQRDALLRAVRKALDG